MNENKNIEINRATLGAMIALIRGLSNLGICPSCVMNLESNDLPDFYRVRVQSAMSNLMDQAKVGDMRKRALPFEEIIHSIFLLKKKRGLATDIVEFENQH